MTKGGAIGPLPNEEQIINTAKKDYRAFEPLYDHYYEQIFRFVLRRTDEEQLAADLVSQTFLKAINNLQSFRYMGVPFGAWLYKIAGNEVKKHYRSRGTKQIFSLEEHQVSEMIDLDEQDDV